MKLGALPDAERTQSITNLPSPQNPMSLTDRGDENALECPRDQRAEIERNWRVSLVHEAD